MKYQFTKPQIRVTTKGYWHDNTIDTIVVQAKSIKEAINKWADVVEDKDYIKISKTARKSPEKMYVDTPDGNAKQVGFVFTASTEIQDDRTGKWKKVNLKLWTNVNILQDVWGK